MYRTMSNPVHCPAHEIDLPLKNEIPLFVDAELVLYRQELVNDALILARIDSLYARALYAERYRCSRPGIGTSSASINS